MRARFGHRDAGMRGDVGVAGLEGGEPCVGMDAVT